MKLTNGALRISVIYAVIGGLWILVSDPALDLLTTDSQTLRLLETFKGWFFILFTSWMLYRLIERFHSELAHSEERSRLVLEVSNDGVWDWNLLTGQVYFSKRWKEMLGYREEELENNINTVSKVIHPDDHASLELYIKEHLEGNVPFCHIVRALHKDGSLRWIQTRGAVIRNDKGEPVRMIGSNLDVTDRKQYEEEIQRLNRLYDVLSQVNSVLLKTESAEGLLSQVCKIAVERGGFKLVRIVRYNPQERSILPVVWAGEPQDYVEVVPIFIDQNPEKLGPTGMAVREGRHYICNDFFADPRTEPWQAKARKVGIAASAVFVIRCSGIVYGALTVFADVPDFFRTKEVALLDEVAKTISFGLDYLERENQRKYAQKALVEAKRNLELKVEERTQELLAMNEELTALNEELAVTNEKLNVAKEEADQASHAKSDFLAKMSHEIRTPLNAIIGLNYLLQKTALTEKQQNYVAKIILSAQNLRVIINDVLDLSKIEANKMDIEQVEFDLYEILNNISNLISFQVYEKNLRLSFSIDANVPQILKGDPFHLQQVLLNITSNAVKFTQVGEISIGAAVEQETDELVKLRFTVHDTGIGIAKQQQDELFTAFSQADMSTTRKYGGTGLGLAICKGLIELMGGAIRVDSEIGRGSTFVITLNFAYNKQAKFAINTAESLKFLRILLVSPDSAIRCVLKGQLTQFGFICSLAASRLEALENLKENRYDLIFVDQKLEEQDGIPAAETIKQYAGQQTPIIMLVSAYRDVSLQSLAEKSSTINSILYYPIGQSQLYNEILTLFERAVKIDAASRGEQEAHHRFTSLRQAKVLLVEDNEINQQVAKDILEEEGIFVDIAENGSKAVTLATERAYDVILMDIQMPVMDGYEAARIIRESIPVNNLPILALTADVVKGVADKVYEAGMNGYIPKPIEPLQLLNTLKRWLDKEPGRKEREIWQIPSQAADECAAVLNQQQLPGLNISQGLARVNGKIDKFAGLLQLFKEKHLHDAEEIRDALLEGKSEQAYRLAHTLKGAAGNIGLEEVFEVAVRLEGRIREQAVLSWCEQEIELLAVKLQAAAAAMETASALLEPQKVTLASLPQLTEKVDMLASMVMLNQLGALELLREIAPNLAALHGLEKLDRLQQALINFDWEKAQHLLAEMGVDPVAKTDRQETGNSDH